jgi:hypothetical protein
MLHVTNGDCAAARLREGGIQGDLLPWRDVLHAGPVPARLSLEELSRVRADFIASSGWTERRKARADFRRRDRELARFRDHEEVVLWFEHDLYDQLQLIQILGWFAERDSKRVRLTLIQTADYLGEMPALKLVRLFPKRRPVTSRQLALGARAWRAFREPEPKRLLDVLDRDTSALPFLDGALLRLFEEYPSARNGLSRTEAQALRKLLEGPQRLAELFVHTAHHSEQRVFLGDLSFQSILENLAGKPSIIRIAPRNGKPFWAGSAELTTLGRSIVHGTADLIEARGIDRWIGGTHLHGKEAVWRWNPDTLRLEN